jgi:hypothetical protein
MKKETYPEKYWHCYVELENADSPHDYYVINDLTFNELQKEITGPWRNSRPFNISGKVIADKAKVHHIKITQTDDPQSRFAHVHDTEMCTGGISDLETDRKLLPVFKGNDYTNKLLF